MSIASATARIICRFVRLVHDLNCRKRVKKPGRTYVNVCMYPTVAVTVTDGSEYKKREKKCTLNIIRYYSIS